MELHLALKNLLAHYGEDYISDPQLVSTLADFEAFGHDPAMRNIFRTLHADGLLEALRNQGFWGPEAEGMIYAIVRDYAFPVDLVRYALGSVAYALGWVDLVATLKNIKVGDGGGRTLPWEALSVAEREAFLNDKVQIRPSRCGIQFNSVYISDCSYDKNLYFNVNFEAAGRLPKFTFVELNVAVYDTLNRVRYKGSLTSVDTDEKPEHFDIIDSSMVCLNFPYTEIGKILIFTAKN